MVNIQISTVWRRSSLSEHRQ